MTWMLNYLREEENRRRDCEPRRCQRFVEHHLKVEDCYPFFASLRSASAEGTKGKKKVRA
jgi:hypothetical protein